ncbi:MAG: hypothetical protein V4641_01740 [Pseudomonadota bacterium]
MTDLQFITLALIGFGSLCACGLLLATLAIEPKDDPIEKMDEERL